MSSKFMKDMCRAVGCDDVKFCTRCNTLSEKTFEDILVNTLPGHIIDERMDELDQVELIMAVEEEYDVEIADELMDTLKTPKHMKNWLQYTLSQRVLDADEEDCDV